MIVRVGVTLTHRSICLPQQLKSLPMHVPGPSWDAVLRAPLNAQTLTAASSLVAAAMRPRLRAARKPGRGFSGRLSPPTRAPRLLGWRRRRGARACAQPASRGRP